MIITISTLILFFIISLLLNKKTPLINCSAGTAKKEKCPDTHQKITRVFTGTYRGKQISSNDKNFIFGRSVGSSMSKYNTSLNDGDLFFADKDITSQKLKLGDIFLIEKTYAKTDKKCIKLRSFSHLTKDEKHTISFTDGQKEPEQHPIDGKNDNGDYFRYLAKVVVRVDGVFDEYGKKAA